MLLRTHWLLVLLAQGRFESFVISRRCRKCQQEKSQLNSAGLDAIQDVQQNTFDILFAIGFE